MTTLVYPYKYQCIPTISYNNSNDRYDILNNMDQSSLELETIEKDFFDELIKQLKINEFISDGINTYLITWNKNGEYISSLNIYNQTNEKKCILLQAKTGPYDYLLGIDDDIPMIRGQEYIKRAKEIDRDAYTFGINQYVIECIDECLEKWTPRKKFTVYKVKQLEPIEQPGVVI